MPPKHKLSQQTILVSGHVQGVGFRYRTCHIARGFDVTGFVRNLSDGLVEVVVEGESAAIGQFMDAVRDEMQDFIRGVESQTSPGTGEFRGFEIRS